jgi:ribosomal protein S27AE
MKFKDYIDIKDFTQVVCPACKALLMADKDMETWYCGHCGHKLVMDEVLNPKPVVKEKPAPRLVGSVFRREGDVLYKYEGNSEDVEIPENITKIASGAFKDNKEVRTVIIPDTVTEIADSAFENCTSLSTVHLPSGLQKINYKTFNGCDSLKTITIPASVEQIMYNAMCCGLEEIVFESSNTTWEPENEYTNPSFWVKKNGKGNGVGRIFLKQQTFNAAEVFRHKSLFTYLRSQGLCTNCGGKFGMFNKCKSCGQKKEY